ncbi:FimV/HubP family polar landmark protein [Vibrio sp. PP-XX7]
MADHENWEIQDDFVDDGDEGHRRLSIDELMAQVDAEGGEFSDIELKLDVGLNEFPDVIGEIENIDVDNNAEAVGKLDLAKIYIEMNDYTGAIKLLEQAIVDGDDNIRRAAKGLIDELNSKR